MKIGMKPICDIQLELPSGGHNHGESLNVKTEKKEYDKSVTTRKSTILNEHENEP